MKGHSASAQPSKPAFARVIVIPSWFPNNAQPHFGSFVLEQVRALAATYQNTEWHVIAPDGAPEWLSARRPIAGLLSYFRSRRHATESPVDEDGNVFIHRVQAMQSSSVMGMLGFAPYKRIVAISLKRIERRFGAIDLLHVHGCYPAGLVVSNLKPARRWVMTEHQSPFPFDELRTADGALWPELRAVFQGTSATIAVSRSHADDIERLTSVRPVVIPNLCDESVFRPGQTIPEQPYTFLTIGGLTRQKGIDVLLTAIAEFRSRGGKARFRIVGTGPLESQLRAQADALGVADLVEWCGSVSRNNLPEVFRSAHAFVLPSRHESFGVVYIEALASGLPIIATRCGGPEDIVHPGNGVLVPVDDHHALADAMLAMVDADYDAESIREDFLVRFARAPVCRQIMSLYESLG